MFIHSKTLSSLHTHLRTISYKQTPFELLPAPGLRGLTMNNMKEIMHRLIRVATHTHNTYTHIHKRHIEHCRIRMCTLTLHCIHDIIVTLHSDHTDTNDAVK